MFVTTKPDCLQSKFQTHAAHILSYPTGTTSDFSTTQEMFPPESNGGGIHQTVPSRFILPPHPSYNERAFEMEPLPNETRTQSVIEKRFSFKINDEPGGLNSMLAVKHSPSNLLISKVPTIIIGMEVTRVSPWLFAAPTIAAVW